MGSADDMGNLLGRIRPQKRFRLKCFAMLSMAAQNEDPLALRMLHRRPQYRVSKRLGQASNYQPLAA